MAAGKSNEMVPKKEVEIQFCDAVQQLASIDEDLWRRLHIDTRGLYPLNSHNWQIVEEDAGGYWAYRDEWGITHHRPKENGLYFSVVKAPLPRTDLTVQDIFNHSWPDVHLQTTGYAVED